MVSFELRPALRRAGILMAAAVSVPCTVLSQPASSPAADNALREIVEEIAEVRSQDGPHSSDLIDPLTGLSLLYQERGEHDLAAAIIAQARLAVRANYGLYSLNEAPLIRQLIHSEEARGNVEEAWDLEQKLLALARRHPNDLRTVPILREIADKRMDVLTRYIGGEFPPQIVLGCYYNRWNRREGCRAGSRGVVVRSLRSEADRYYAQAARIVARNERWTTLGILSCERPSMAEIPDEEGLSKREVRSVQREVLQYLTEMSAYVDCVQAQHINAASMNAPPSRLSHLAAENNAAVAEAEQVRVAYEERIGPITELVR